MPILLPIATALCGVLTVKTLNKTSKVMKKRKNRRMRDGA